MKRQTQKLGVRDWYGSDLISLQEEPLKVIDSFFSQFGAFVLAGCEVRPNGNKFDIAPGLVVLDGNGADGMPVKVVAPFAGATATTLPIYLTLGCEAETDVYHDGAVKPIAYAYSAVATTVKPSAGYLEIKQSTPRFADVLQDARHRFISDAERAKWNNKEDAGVAKQESEKALARTVQYDYVVDSDEALNGLADNPNATSVLIKKGRWTADGYLTLHPNTKRIFGEAGNVVCVETFGYASRPQESVGYSIEGVNIETGYRGFVRMVNMVNCSVHGTADATYVDYAGFFDCMNLSQCTATGHYKGFKSCHIMSQCYSGGIKPASMDVAPGFEKCIDVSQCRCAAGITHCYLVRNCYANSFNWSYSCPGARSGYECGDSLNGGWNQRL